MHGRALSIVTFSVCFLFSLCGAGAVPAPVEPDGDGGVERAGGPALDGAPHGPLPEALDPDRYAARRCRALSEEVVTRLVQASAEAGGAAPAGALEASPRTLRNLAALADVRVRGTAGAEDLESGERKSLRLAASAARQLAAGLDRIGADGDCSDPLQAREMIEPLAEAMGRVRALPVKSGAHAARPTGPSGSIDGAVTPRLVPPPGNDECEGAATLVDQASGDSTFALNDGGAGCGVSSSTPDVWYRYTPPADGTVLFDTVDASYDTVLSLHSACPGIANNQLACNDDSDGTLLSSIEAPVTDGTDVLVRVSGYDGAAGTFTVRARRVGSITGTVREEGTTNPVGNGQVDVFDTAGERRARVFIGIDGTYEVPLMAGDYFLRVRAHDYVDELYPEIACVGDCDPLTGDPVTVTAGVTTSGIDFFLSTGGTVSGTVTASDGGGLLDGVGVTVYDADGAVVDGRLTDTGGDYTIAGLTTGNYFLTAESGAHVDELYNDIRCVPSCYPPDGTAVPVSSGSTTPDVDFALDAGGEIEGTVTEEATNDPIVDATVTVLTADGARVVRVPTAADGTYSVTGLPDGDYRVRVGAVGFVNEIHNDDVCLSCQAELGFPVPVSEGFTTPEIDFALAAGATIQGTLTQSGKGTPLASKVVLANSTERDFAFGFTDSNGSYTVDGLPARDWFVNSSTSEYVDELWDDTVCVRSFCQFWRGTPVPIAAEAAVTGIDLALEPGGVISGTVTAEGTGDPIEDVSVYSRNPDGQVRARTASRADGSYRLRGLPGGEYTVRTSLGRQPSPPFLMEQYDDVPCAFECDPSTATPVTVTAGFETPGIDFALDPGGAIEGTVIRSDTSAPVPEVRAALYDAAGEWRGGHLTDPDGGYRLAGLPAGDYFVRAGATRQNLIDEVWNDVPCPAADLTTAGDPQIDSCALGIGGDGDAVGVAEGVTTAGIDFALDPAGAVSGTVRRADGGLILFDPFQGHPIVQILAPDGAVVQGIRTASDGTYRAVGVPPGDHYAATESIRYDEVWNDVPCPSECDPTIGSSFPVTAGAEVTGIDFELDTGGAMTGTVVDAGASPLYRGIVWIFDSSDRFVTTVVTDPDGAYRASGLPAGDLFALAAYPWTAEWAREVYEDLPCDIAGGECGPSYYGDSISVMLDTVTTDVHFDLLPQGGCGSAADLVLDDHLLDATVVFEACNTITADTAFEVGPSGDLTLRAGRQIRFGDGFSVNSGGALTVVVDPVLAD